MSTFSLAALVALAGTAIAQPCLAQHRVGVLLLAEDCPTPPLLVSNLAALGWVAGRTIHFDCVSENGPSPLDQVNAVARDLVARRPVVIVASFLPAAIALKAATSTIPIVMLNVADPVRQGLVESLPRPGGNLTGQASVLAEVETKRIELLREAVPGFRRLAVVARAGPAVRYFEDIEQMLAGTAGTLHFSYEWFRVASTDELPSLFRGLASKGFDAIYLVPMVWLYTSVNVPIVGEAVRASGLPTITDDISADRHLAKEGVLLTYGPSRVQRFRRAANYVDKILRGAKPANLPVEEPSQFELVVNARVAKTLGLTLPEALLARADEVIE